MHALDRSKCRHRAWANQIQVSRRDAGQHDMHPAIPAWRVHNTFVEVMDQHADGKGDPGSCEVWTDERADVVYKSYPDLVLSSSGSNSLPSSITKRALSSLSDCMPTDQSSNSSSCDDNVHFSLAGVGLKI